MRSLFQRLSAATVAAAIFAALGAAGPAAARCEGYVPEPKPQNTSRDYVGQTLDEIRERGWIDIALYEDFPPYSYEKDGKAAGIDVEIGRIIAEDLGVEARFRLVQAGETLDADLRNWVWKGPVVGGKVANVMMRVPYDSDFACRVDQVVFTGQYATESIAVAYDKDHYPDDPPVPAYFRYDTVAVENDSIADFYLTNLLGQQANPNIHRYPTMEAAMKALANHEVNAAMGPLGQLQAAATDTIGVHSPPLPAFSIGTWTLGVAVHTSHRDLGYAIDDAIGAAIADGRIAAIYEAHGLGYRPPAER